MAKPLYGKIKEKEMGRVRVQLKKIENKTYRHITFAKRKTGLVKKAYELSTLCDVEVALIIFSPAGKLILFDGKKRVEEILMHYIDLPHHQRGRLHDQELVRQIIAQITLEAELRHHIASAGDRDRKMILDSQLEEIKNEIRVCNSELEEVEKQLQYFVRSPSCIKSISEADCHEQILEDTLKLVCVHKQALEAKRAIQLTYNSEIPLHPLTASARSFIMGSSNYCLDWPQQHDTQILTPNFASSPRLQSLRDQSQPLLEMIQSSSPYIRGALYPAGNAATRGSQLDGYVYYSDYDRFYNADFPQEMNNLHQGRANKTAGPSKVVDATVAYQYHGNCFQHDCGDMPFPYS